MMARQESQGRRELIEQEGKSPALQSPPSVLAPNINNPRRSSFDTSRNYPLPPSLHPPSALFQSQPSQPQPCRGKVSHTPCPSPRAAADLCRIRRQQVRPLPPCKLLRTPSLTRLRSLCGSGAIDKAAIFSADGTSVWAQTSGFVVCPPSTPPDTMSHLTVSPSGQARRDGRGVQGLHRR